MRRYGWGLYRVIERLQRWMKISAPSSWISTLRGDLWNREVRWKKKWKDGCESWSAACVMRELSIKNLFLVIDHFDYKKNDNIEWKVGLIEEFKINKSITTVLWLICECNQTEPVNRVKQLVNVNQGWLSGQQKSMRENIPVAEAIANTTKKIIFSNQSSQFPSNILHFDANKILWIFVCVSYLTSAKNHTIKSFGFQQNLVQNQSSWRRKLYRSQFIGHCTCRSIHSVYGDWYGS